MKKITGIIILMLLATTGRLNAQTGQGNIIVGGASTISFGSETRKATLEGDQVGNKEKTSSFGLKPSVGYFVIDNLSVGLTLVENYSKTKYRDEDNNDLDYSNKTNTFLIGPMARYYYGTSKLRPFGQAFLVFGSTKSETTIGDVSTTDKFKTFGLGLGLGAAYLINDNVSIDAVLGYSYFIDTDTEETDYKEKSQTLDLEIGISVYF